VSDAPTKLFDCEKAAFDRRAIVLGGGKGDYRFLPDPLLEDPAKATAEAAAVLDEGLNAAEGNQAAMWEDFKVANAICAAARDHLAVGRERVVAIVAHLNELEQDRAGRLASIVPGYPQEEP
jgi:hypothetical protein